MKVRSARNAAQANKIFTDREEPRKTFWEHYDALKAQLSDIADIRVIAYYGIGGIGKSTLLRKLIGELTENIDKPNYTYYDLGVASESRAVLEALRNKLSKDYGYSFPLFDLGMYTYACKIGENIEPEEIKSFADKSKFLSLIFEVGQALPGVSVVSQIVKAADAGVAYARNVPGKHRQEIYEFEALSADELYTKLPYLFSLDMTDNLQGKSEPFVVFLDTYEKLVNEMSSVGEPLNNDLWLRDENGLIQNIPNVLWVIAGREKLKWTRFDPEWADALEQYPLGSLSYTDAASFLSNAGITDEKLIQDIYELTHGTPVYLDLCVDRYAALSPYKAPGIDDFGHDTYTLIERFARYMDDGKKDIVYMLSCLASWEEELIHTIASRVIPNFSITSYEKVKDFSFVTETEAGIYTIHQTVSETLCKSCPDLIRKNTISNALDFYLAKLTGTNVFSNDLSFYLNAAVRLSLLKYEDDDKYFEFFKNNLGSIFSDFTEAGRFDIIDDALEPIFKRAQRSDVTPKS